MGPDWRFACATGRRSGCSCSPARRGWGSPRRPSSPGSPPRTAERWAAGLLPHSDRGGHYRWPGWVALCRGNRLVRSMSRKGRSCDNARMEGFFGTLKSEFFHSRDWEGVDRNGSMVELHRWLKWFRSGRVSESLGWRTPDGNRRLLGYAV